MPALNDVLDAIRHLNPKELLQVRKVLRDTEFIKMKIENLNENSKDILHCFMEQMQIKTGNAIPLHHRTALVKISGVLDKWLNKFNPPTKIARISLIKKIAIIISEEMIKNYDKTAKDKTFAKLLWLGTQLDNRISHQFPYNDDYILKAIGQVITHEDGLFS